MAFSRDVYDKGVGWWEPESYYQTGLNADRNFDAYGNGWEVWHCDSASIQISFLSLTKWY